MTERNVQDTTQWTTELIGIQKKKKMSNSRFNVCKYYNQLISYHAKMVVIVFVAAIGEWSIEKSSYCFIISFHQAF